MKRYGVIFHPAVFVEVDADGGNPVVTDVDWSDSYRNTTDLDAQKVIHEEPHALPQPVMPLPAFAVCEYIDEGRVIVTMKRRRVPSE